MGKNEQNLPATLDTLVTAYPALSEEVAMEMKDALGGEQISARFLPAIKLPSGGSVTFEIPVGGQEVDPRKAVEGIVLAYQVGRKFYPNKDVTNVPPDCHSTDGIHGYGRPGGMCGKCPFAEWGSAADGQGQACKQSGSMAILLPGMGLAYILQVPPTSLKAMNQYKVAVLAQTMGPMHNVITSLSLEKKQNPAGQPYAVLVPRIVGSVPKEAKPVIKAMAETYKGVLLFDENRPADENHG